MRHIELTTDLNAEAIAFHKEPTWSDLAERIEILFSIPSKHVVLEYSYPRSIPLRWVYYLLSWILQLLGLCFVNENLNVKTISTQKTLEVCLAETSRKEVVKYFVADRGVREYRVDLLMNIHHKAWGQVWPHHKKTVYKEEIHIPVGEDFDYMYPDGIELPEHLEYTCIDDLRQVSQTLSCTTTDFVIVLSEYKTVLECIIEEVKIGRKHPSFIMTGHPGNGKSTFLLYLLLYRLERMLPTAVQFCAKYYIVFDAQGAQVHHCDFYNEDLPQGCWALIDLTCKGTIPSQQLMNEADCVILSSPPDTNRWANWKGEFRPQCFVSALPEVLEIAAVLKEASKEVFRTLDNIVIYGPSIQTIKRVLDPNLHEHNSIENRVKAAVMVIYQNPSTIIAKVNTTLPYSFTSEWSSVVFLRPCRGSLNDISERNQLFIPTRYLRMIAGSEWLKLKK